uniref:Uncharacterized protein n=1 Tax=Anguilla anguilla TaxID=7936 RepID=A0A0E9PKC8_ANGAN
MTPMMWKLFKGRLDMNSLFLSPHDSADTNGKRLLLFFFKFQYCENICMFTEL